VALHGEGIIFLTKNLAKGILKNETKKQSKLILAKMMPPA
jgi:hypothetical protein